MARRRHLPENLSPAQVIALQDALLSNADRLLQAALLMLDSDNVPLARSLTILGMEESGKAIAIHERRVAMAHAPEGEPFVDERLQNLWSDHGLKLRFVHDFLVNEQYWFGVDMPDHEENARTLGTIKEWQRDHNVLKQRGFYVDVSLGGDPVTPQEVADSEAVREVVAYVHQIGWQLRLGEHIEGKHRLEAERDDPPVSEEEIEAVVGLLKRAAPEVAERIAVSMRKGRTGEKLNNAGYAFVLPENPFETIGRPGYEAEDRELRTLWDHVSSSTDEESVSES